jgi:hypothetical protein
MVHDMVHILVMLHELIHGMVQVWYMVDVHGMVQVLVHGCTWYRFYTWLMVHGMVGTWLMYMVW